MGLKQRLFRISRLVVMSFSNDIYPKWLWNPCLIFIWNSPLSRGPYWFAFSEASLQLKTKPIHRICPLYILRISTDDVHELLDQSAWPYGKQVMSTQRSRISWSKMMEWYSLEVVNKCLLTSERESVTEQGGTSPPWWNSEFYWVTEIRSYLQEQNWFNDSCITKANLSMSDSP